MNGSLPFPPPSGYVVDRRGDALLVADPRRLTALRRAGLDDPLRWRELLVPPSGQTSGRGSTVVLPLGDGVTVRLKQLRRGGIAGALWRNRMLGRRRLLDNLRIPAEAARRGVATPRAAGLLMVAGPPGLYRGWLALDEIADAVDLATRCTAGPAPSPEEWKAALREVRRMHDAGVEHPDLNLGNLLVRRGSTGVCAFVVDLDGARIRDRPLGLVARRRALRRLERSYVKTRRAEADEALRRDLYTFYAGNDGPLADGLTKGRRAGRLWIRLHSLTWRR